MAKWVTDESVDVSTNVTKPPKKLPKGSLKAWSFPPKAKVGEWNDFYVDVENSGEGGGYVGWKLINKEGNPGTVVVKVNDTEGTLAPGYAMVVFQYLNPGDSFETYGDIKFESPGSYTLTLEAGHYEEEE